MNFADETEAANFQAAIEDKLTERRLRRERRMASKRQSQNGSTNSTPRFVLIGFRLIGF